MVRGRSAGQAIVSEARRRGVEAIVLGAEEPSRLRGGAILGGRGRVRDRFVGETTRYVIEKAPCKVILTAPPAGEEGTSGGGSALEWNHDVRSDRGLRPSRVRNRKLHAGGGPRGLRPRRGRRGHRPARPRRGRAAGRSAAGSSPRAPRSRSTRCSRRESSARTPSSPRPTATTPTSSSRRSRSAASTSTAWSSGCSTRRGRAGTRSRASRPSARRRPPSSCSRRPCAGRSASREWRASSCTS